MYALRAILIAVFGLPMLASWLAAAEPQPGKLRLIHCRRNRNERLGDRVFSTDGRLLIVGNNPDGSNYVRLWDPKLGKEMARCSLGKESAYHIVFSPDGKTVACYSHMAKAICVFEVASGKLIFQIAQPREVLDILFCPDGRSLIARRVPGGLRLWDVKTGKELWRLHLQLPEKSPWQLRERWESCHTLAFSPNGKVLAVALEDGSIHLCDMKTGREVRRLFRAVSNHILSQMAFSPDGGYLAASAEENVKERNLEGEERYSLGIRLWDLRSAQLVRTFKQFRPPLPLKDWGNFRVAEQHFVKYGRDTAGLAFSPDGKTVMNCGWITQLWEVATGRLRHEFDTDSRYAGRFTTYAGSFSPDGHLFVANSLAVSDGQTKSDEVVHSAGIRLWDWRDPCLKQPTSLTLDDIEKLWRDLASGDAAVGYRAIAILLAHPQRAVATLKERLRRVEPVTPGELDRLIANLDDGAFAVRERATERLAALGEVARPALLRVNAQRPTLEVRRRIEDLFPRLAPAGMPDRLRCLRAVEVLETVGTEDARRVLTKLASGADGSLETEDAKAALKRLNRN